MKNEFRIRDYLNLHSIVFKPDYPGYTPNVAESPNGDGKLDTLKRYAHVSKKHCETLQERAQQMGRIGLSPEKNKLDDEIDLLDDYLTYAQAEAEHMAVALGVPPAFWPDINASALRVLEYGPDAVTHPHTDFDLFTLSCYRNSHEHFKYLIDDKMTLESHDRRKVLKKARDLSPGIHFGELLEEILPQSFKATKHEVVASKVAYQYSVVYFAVPSHDAVLPSGLTVGQWMDDRKKRSRYTV